MSATAKQSSSAEGPSVTLHTADEGTFDEVLDVLAGILIDNARRSETEEGQSRRSTNAAA